MSAAAIRGVIRRLGPGTGPPTDGDLVRAFAASRDHSAFAELVRRHGPTVLGVCRRVLADAHDAEDAFQAVFLVLARKAAAVRPPGAVGGWLYGVAVRTANKARVAAARRRRREMNVAASAQASRERQLPVCSVEDAELRAVLDAELSKLPDAVRAAVVLCDLHGRTRSEAAAELGCPEGTVAARLHRGRKKLGEALARRGLALPAAGLGAVLAPAPVSATLSQSALALASGTASAAARALAHEVIRSKTTITNTLAVGLLALLTGGVLAAGTLLSGEPAPDQKTPPAKDDPVAIASEPKTAPKPLASPWRETKVLELTGWLAGSVAFAPDGKALYVGGTGEHVGAFATDTWKRLWGRFDGPGRLPPPGSHFGALAVSPDGKTLAVATKDGVVFLDALLGRATGDRLEEKGSAPLAVGWFPDRLTGADGVPPVKQVAFGNARGYFVKTWLKWPDVSTIRSSTTPEEKIPADEYAAPLAVSHNGKWAVVTGPIDRDTGKNVLWAWSAGSGESNHLLVGHKAAVTSAAWSQDGKWIVTGDAARTVIVWDAVTFKEKSRVLFPPGRVAAVAVSGDGMHIAAAVAIPLEQLPGKESYSEEVFVWPAESPPKQPKAISRTSAGGPFAGVGSLAFAPDGKTLVSTFCNFTHLSRLGELVGKVRVFAIERPKPEKPTPEPPAAEQKWSEAAVLKDHNALVNGVAVAPDGKTFAAATDRGAVCWDAVTRQKLWTYQPKAGKLFALAYSPDGKHLCVAGENDVTRLDARTGKEDAWLDPAGVRMASAMALAYSPDGKLLGAGTGPGGINLYPVGGGKPTGTVGVREAGDEDPIPVGLAWEPNGKAYATTARLKSRNMYPVFVNSLTGRNEWFPFLEHKTPVTALAWSADGKVIASGDAGGVVVLWDPVTGKELWRKELKGRTTIGRVNAIAISPADNTVAVAVSLGSGKGPERVVLLDGKEGKDVDFLQARSIPVSSVAWSPDGKFLVTGCGSIMFPIPNTEDAVGEVAVWERKP